MSARLTAGVVALPPRIANSLIRDLIRRVSRFLHAGVPKVRTMSAQRAAARNDLEGLVAHTLTNEAWLSACLERRLAGDDDPLDALRGITLGALLSTLMFWMPLAIALTRLMH